jgi:hypothetical protein
MQMLTQLIDQTVEPSVQVFGTQLVFRSSLGTAPA